MAKLGKKAKKFAKSSATQQKRTKRGNKADKGALKKATSGKPAKRGKKKEESAEDAAYDKAVEGMDVDSFLDGGFLEANSDDGEDEPEETRQESDEEEEEEDDDENATMHKEELEKLSKSDPEFFEYLKKNDQKLLNFDDDDDESEEEEEEGDEAVEEDGEKEKSGGKAEQVELSSKYLDGLERSAFSDFSVKGLRRLINAFRDGCRIGKDSEVKGRQQFVINSSAVFDKLMMLCLSNIHKAFHHHLFGEKDADPKLLHQCAAFPKISNMLESFLRSLIYLLGELSDTSMQCFVLKSMELNAIPYLHPFQKLSRKMIKALLQLWGTTQEQDVCAAAFLRLRQLALLLPASNYELCYKGIYLSYVRNAKFVSEVSLPVITFRGNCVVEFYGLDLKTAYQHAFVYIRQVSLHLRSAIVTKKKEALEKVYNWQFFNCLKVWSAVIAAYPAEDQLKPLVYPLVQIVIGVVRLVPTARFIPMRLHCVELLHQLADAANIYIPSCCLLLDVFQFHELAKKPQASTAKPPNLVYAIKIPPSAWGTRVAQEAVVARTFELLRREAELYQFNIGFPEIILSSVARLKTFSKSTKVSRWAQMAKGVSQFMVKQAAMVRGKRSLVSFSPNDAKQVSQFLAAEKQKRKEQLAKQAANPPAEAEPAKQQKKKQNQKRKKQDEPAKQKKGKANAKQTKNNSKKAKLAKQPIPQGSMDDKDEIKPIDWSDSSDDEAA